VRFVSVADSGRYGDLTSLVVVIPIWRNDFVLTIYFKGLNIVVKERCMQSVYCVKTGELDAITREALFVGLRLST
jgi:hypothetical protein